MTGFEEEKSGVFGGVEFESGVEQAGVVNEVAQDKSLPVKNDFWSKTKAFWLQDIPWNAEIKVVLTPFQQKVENEINEFLHQEITWAKVHDFLFQEITFGKKK